MKIRADFVTNSSSSSFVIHLKDLTGEQAYKICNHLEYAKENMPEMDLIDELDASDRWVITVKDNYLCGFTFMDNFDMYYFLKKIGVDMEKVTWGKFSFGQPEEFEESKE